MSGEPLPIHNQQRRRSRPVLMILLVALIIAVVCFVVGFVLARAFI
jgi:hypothetical protein